MQRELTWHVARRYVRQVVATLGSELEIYRRVLGGRKNPRLLEFVEVLLAEMDSRSTDILCIGSPPKKAIDKAVAHTACCANIAEMAVLTLANLLDRKGTVADLKQFQRRLWAALFAVDVAGGLCTDRQSWVPPPETAEVLSAIGREIAQSSSQV